MLINSLVEMVGLVQNDVARINHRFVNNSVNHCPAKPHPEEVQMLVEYEGQLVPFREPIDLAERRQTPHLHTVIDLTDENDEEVLDSEGLVRDFMVVSGLLYLKLSMCFEGTLLTQLV